MSVQRKICSFFILQLDLLKESIEGGLLLSKREKSIAAVAVLFAMLALWQWLSPSTDVSTEPMSMSLESEFEDEVASTSQDFEAPKEPAMIVVDVKGAVQSPGVYHIEKNDAQRIEDVIEKAGGLTEKADVNAVNRAQKLYDEAVVYVPEKGDEANVAWPNVTEGDQDKMSINRASQSELEQLNGIGPAKAKAIINYREEQGPFQQLDDLLNVSGIGDKSFEQLKDHIRL